MTIAANMPKMQTGGGHSINADLTQGTVLLRRLRHAGEAVSRSAARSSGGKIAHREKDYGIWLSYTWADFYEHAG